MRVYGIALRAAWVSTRFRLDAVGPHHWLTKPENQTLMAAVLPGSSITLYARTHGSFLFASFLRESRYIIESNRYVRRSWNMSQGYVWIIVRYLRFLSKFWALSLPLPSLGSLLRANTQSTATPVRTAQTGARAHEYFLPRNARQPPWQLQWETFHEPSTEAAKAGLVECLLFHM